MTADIDTYARAWEYVTLKHMGQTYGGRSADQQIPYINHLASVAAEVAWGIGGEAGWDAGLAIQCALLHDVIEDTNATFDDVRDRFGIAVARGVQALSKDAQLGTSALRMQDTLRRIQLEPKEVWAVKLADRIANLYHPPFYWNADKVAQYKIEARTILDALGSASPRLAARLADKIAAYGALL
ncbi:HD domain-containing protein [Massilia sp. TSP1-1-2]|uniref:HD domain-containing protein n=1 Tax=unclassified Massilia TaxID=2609279 RepID=UPI003CF96DC3